MSYRIEHEGLKTENAALKEVDRWIPVSEKLPHDDNMCLVAACYSGKLLTLKARYNSRKFGNWYTLEFGWKTAVIWWRLLPEPPESGNYKSVRGALSLGDIDPVKAVRELRGHEEEE